VFRSRVFRDKTGRKLLNKSVPGVEIRVSSLDGIARRDTLPVSEAVMMGICYTWL
jgi:hypothetical protein